MTTRSRAGHIALVLISLALTLALVEGALRIQQSVTRATDKRGLHEPRPDRPWLYGLRPGAEGTLESSGDVVYRINADGFRDFAYSRPKPEGTFRVIVLGDSVAFGYGVELERSFPKVMENELAQLARLAGRQPIEVLNMGVSGYNSYTQAQLLRGLGASYQPDLILVQFCINDLNDPTLHFDVQTRLHLGSIPDAAYPDPNARRAPVHAPGMLLRWCRRSLICSRVDDLFVAATAPEPSREQKIAAAAPVDDALGAEWKWLENLYLEMAETSRDIGADFAVVAFPFPDQLKGSSPYGVQERLVAIGGRNGWITVDPLPLFREASRSGSELFLDWWHPTTTGHRLAAREIDRALACADLLPESARVLCRAP